MILEESKPVGVSSRIPYLLIELRNRIALKCAVDRLLASKRPVVAMGALHAFGIKAATARAGLKFEMWAHESLARLLARMR